MKPIKIGLLGGGQLARMLALAGHNLGFEMHVLSASQSDPAAQVVRHHQVGDPNDFSAANAFLKSVDVATFESEFLDISVLKSAINQTNSPVIPSPALMDSLQDRLTQKQLLVQAELPTSRFIPVQSPIEAIVFLRQNRKGIVLKQRRYGYDGYGTHIARSEKELRELERTLKSYKWGYIAEDFVTFRRELAITLVRNAAGDVTVFPLVESHQKDSRCYWVKGPATHPRAGALVKKLILFISQMNYCGAVSFELFDSKKGLLINEVAPRVHNSCHYSIDAMTMSQFSAHLLAISGSPLPKTQALSKGFAMVNLLGKTKNLPSWIQPEGILLHWYGKSENRPGRKLGHLNALAATPEKALRIALNAEGEFAL